MFNSGNCGVPLMMNVEPAGTNNGGNNGNNGWGGDGAWLIWIVLIFALFGWGNNGWGNNGGRNGGYAVPYMVGSSYTDASLQRGFDTQTIIGKLDGLNAGVCDSTFALNNSITSGFAGVNNAICDLGYTINTNIMQGNFGLQNAINSASVANMQGQNALASQLAQCCCDNRAAIAQVRYDMAQDTCSLQNTMNNNTRDIIESQNAGTRAILDYLCQDKIATLQAENQSLKLAASQADQNNFIAATQNAQTAELIRRLGADCPQPAYVVQPPQPVTFPTNCCGGVNYAGYGNSGCGCGNSGCC